MSNIEVDTNVFDPQLMANSLETYLDMFDKYVIKSGLTVEEYEESKKKIKKLIKHLRNGNLDKVIDEERYNQLVSNHYMSGNSDY